MSNCSSAGVALKGPARAGCRGCPGRPRGGKEGEAAARQAASGTLQNREGRMERESCGKDVRASFGHCHQNSPLLTFHLKFHFLSAQLEIILIVSWGSAGVEAPNSRGKMRDGPGEGVQDRKPPCSEKPANIRWRHIFLFCMQKENFLPFLHSQLSPTPPRTCGV